MIFLPILYPKWLRINYPCYPKKHGQVHRLPAPKCPATWHHLQPNHLEWILLGPPQSKKDIMFWVSFMLLLFNDLSSYSDFAQTKDIFKRVSPEAAMQFFLLLKGQALNWFNECVKGVLLKGNKYIIVCPIKSALSLSELIVYPKEKQRFIL